MRTVLRLLGSRYGIALVLIVVILAVVGFGRTLFGDADQPSNDAFGPTVAPAATSPDPFSSLGDDSVEEPGAVTPSLSKGAANASAVADRFAKAWLRKPELTAEQWRSAMKPDASADLMTEFADSDPNDVPATTLIGPVALEDLGSDVRARIPADGGTIVLELQVIGGRWQVTSLDWEVA